MDYNNSGSSGRRLAGRGGCLWKRTKCLVASTAADPHVAPKQGGWKLRGLWRLISLPVALARPCRTSPSASM